MIASDPFVPGYSPEPTDLDWSRSRAPHHTLCDSILALEGSPLFIGVSSAWSISRQSADGDSTGVFLRWTRPVETAPASFHEIPLGRIAGLRRFTSCHRYVPFWLKPVAGTTESDVKPETLWILAEKEDIPGSLVGPSRRYLLVVPLLSATTRHALQGSATGLVLTAETGDPATPCEASDALFVATGGDPYALLAASARAVSRHLGTGRLRSEKSLPDSIDDFGWCTWDAFYKDVSPAGVLAGLTSFSAGGVTPRLVILDDGWQSTCRAASGEEYLSSFAPNARFGHDLGPLIREAKQRHGVRHFFVWHALLGYWGGVCDKALPGYDARLVPRLFGPGVLSQESTWNTGPWGAQLSVPAADRFAAFYDDYHHALVSQGVDGVKVDAQAMLEAGGWGQGGRMPLAFAARSGLERSARRHFGGRLINCMASSGECAYLSAESALLRTSDDFWPDRPETHGAHLHTNAQVSLWMGEFMQPDWDMFQSAHERGSYHAAARAISGGPVYVSDKVGAHDFDLLRKLVLSDGTVLRTDLPGRPSPDCLFADPTREAVALKLFNLNGDCGVVGIFNARPTSGDGQSKCLGCRVSPKDIPPLAGENFVGFAHCRNTAWLATSNAGTEFQLGEGEWEIVTYAPVEHGFAAIGLADKLNSAGALVSREWHGSDRVYLRLRDGGRFLFWSDREPTTVIFRDAMISPRRIDGAVYECNLPAGASGLVVIGWV
ncbi:MAG: Sip1-related alpha-galactosidase [Opitutaceae bacterium]|jgi:raffinose synthase